MSVLARTRLASLSVLLLAGTALVPGAPPASAGEVSTTFDRPHQIDFLDASFDYDSPPGEIISVPASGAATPYPSQVTVDQPGFVLDVDVNLDFAHGRPDDLDLMLVGPQGHAVMLMSDAGGTTPTNTNTGLFGGLTLDDEAPNALPDEGLIGELGRSYQPADYGEVPDTFPAPAPPAASPGSALGAFDGTTAAGVWSLYVVDDNGAESGEVTRWQLRLDLAAPGTYPSELQVSGIGLVTDLDISINGFDTEFGRDMTFLLVGPQGQQTVLMNDVGGDSSQAVKGKNLRFDDEAPNQVPEFEALESMSYQPTDADQPDADYRPPAPPWSSPSGLGRPTSLGVFDGTDPNGTWRLFGFDDSGGDVSAMDGWSLHVRWSDAVQPAGSVVVDDGAARTRTRTVDLDLTATDPSPGTAVTSMRLSNDGAAYGPWVPYAATTSWQLASGNGTRSVYVQLRDGSGNVSEALRDTIVLDTKAPRGKKASPEDSARHVAPGARLKVWASERLAPSTVKATTVKLTRGGDPVAAKVTYVGKLRKVVVDPKQALQPGTYRLKVTTKVTDLAGNRWDQRAATGRQPLVVEFRV